MLIKLLRYWLCGFLVIAILTFSLLGIFLLTGLITGPLIDVETSESGSQILNIHPLAWVITGLVTFLICPIIIGVVSDWVSDKVIK